MCGQEKYHNGEYTERCTKINGGVKELTSMEKVKDV